MVKGLAVVSPWPSLRCPGSGGRLKVIRLGIISYGSSIVCSRGQSTHTAEITVILCHKMTQQLACRGLYRWIQHIQAGSPALSPAL